MTADSFHVDPAGVRNLARVHADVAAALDNALAASTSEIDGFEQRYGPIAAPAQAPLSEILAARGDMLRGLSAAGVDLSERLASAARSYEAGDEGEATAIRSSGD